MFYLLHDVLFVACAAKVVECCRSGVVINPFSFFFAVICSTCRHAVGISDCILLSGCGRGGSGLKLTIFFFQIHLKLRSNSTSIQTQFNSQSFQIHNHFKFNSDFKSHSRQKTPSSESTSCQVYGAPKVRTCWLENALYFLKARLGSCFILAISRMFRFGISDSSAGDEAQFLDVGK